MKSPNRKRLAGLAALVVGAGAAVGLAAAPAEAQTAMKYEIVDGEITWGVKESFRTYVVGPIAGGAIAVSDGAVQNADGTFTFGDAAGVTDLTEQTYAAETVGGVQFTGHHGGLDLTLENIEFTADHGTYSGQIIADVTSLGERSEDVPLVDFDYSGVPSPWTNTDGFARLDNVPTTLTEEGAAVFGNYPAGTAMDPVSIAIKTDMTKPIEDDPSEDPSDDPTSEDPSDEPSSAPPSGEPAQVYEVTGGDADWGVKESYRQYVTGPIANGEITVAAPATENPDETYHFPDATGTFTAETCAIDVAFAGGVNFYGHDGQMDLDVADVSVKSTTGSLALYSGATHIADVAVTELAVANGTITVDGAAATVSADGVDFFGGFYTAGTALDPVSFTVEVDGAPDTTCEPSGDGGNGNGDGSTATTTKPASGIGSPKLPTTGSPLTFVLAAAAALLIGGVSVMVLARRRAFRGEA
jgi:hypothetical protein